MGLSPEVILFIIGGLVTALWGLLMWRLQSMEQARREGREGLKAFFDKFEAHVTEDRELFRNVTQLIHDNHIELLERVSQHGS